MLWHSSKIFCTNLGSIDVRKLLRHCHLKFRLNSIGSLLFFFPSSYSCSKLYGVTEDSSAHTILKVDLRQRSDVTLIRKKTWLHTDDFSSKTNALHSNHVMKY